MASFTTPGAPAGFGLLGSGINAPSPVVPQQPPLQTPLQTPLQQQQPVQQQQPFTLGGIADSSGAQPMDEGQGGGAGAQQEQQGQEENEEGVEEGEEGDEEVGEGEVGGGEVEEEEDDEGPPFVLSLPDTAEERAGLAGKGISQYIDAARVRINNLMVVPNVYTLRSAIKRSFVQALADRLAYLESKGDCSEQEVAERLRVKGLLQKKRKGTLWAHVRVPFESAMHRFDTRARLLHMRCHQAFIETRG